jgi:hypothetical protein
MSLRSVDKEKTAQKAREAIERIKQGVPKNRKLKKRTKLKLNQNTVEIEAGLSIRALKHHPDVLMEIQEYTDSILKVGSIAKVDSTDTVDSSANLGLLKREVVKLKEQKKKLLQEKRDDSSQRKSDLQTIVDLREYNKAMQQNHAEVVSAMYNLIPQEQRSNLFERISYTVGNNVIPIK